MPNEAEVEAFVPGRAIKPLAAYSLGIALPEAETTAERLLEWNNMRDENMESPEMVSNLHFVTLPELLMDLLEAEDPEGKLDRAEAGTVLALGGHLERKYCQHLLAEGRVDSCEAPKESVVKQMDVVLEATSKDHAYYRVKTRMDTQDATPGSRTYHGHAECFREERERGRECQLRLRGSYTSYTKHCKFPIETGRVCRNGPWLDCSSGPWVWDPCSFNRDGVTYHGDCNEEGQCVGTAAVQVQADGQVAALESCKSDDCRDYRGR